MNDGGKMKIYSWRGNEWYWLGLNNDTSVRSIMMNDENILGESIVVDFITSVDRGCHTCRVNRY